MSDQNPPSPPARAPGRFKTVVAWVCGPIVLVQLIALIFGTAYFYKELNAKDGRKTYVSMARLLVGGVDATPKQENGTPIADEFYGTMIELLQGSAVIRGAQSRVHALHPDLPPHMAELKVGRMPGTRILILRSSCEDPAFAQAFLDAVMDEFMRLRRETAGVGTSEEMIVAMQDGLVRLERDMQRTEERQRAAKQGGASAEELDKLKSDMERTKRLYDRLLENLRDAERQPRTGNFITILERASKAVSVRPIFSFSNLLK